MYASTTAAAQAFTDEATTANTAKTRYSITDRAKSAWPLTATITVKKNTVVQTTGFHLERAIGVVVFDVALTTETITVTGTYATVAEVGGFYSWKNDSSVSTQDITDFVAARAGWETHMATALPSSKVTAQRFWDYSGFVNRVDDLVLVKCFVSVATGEQFTGWAYCTGSGADADRTKVIEEPLEFVITGGLFHRDTA